MVLIPMHEQDLNLVNVEESIYDIRGYKILYPNHMLLSKKKITKILNFLLFLHANTAAANLNP